MSWYIAILPEAGVSRSFRVRECKTGAVRMAAEAELGEPVMVNPSRDAAAATEALRQVAGLTLTKLTRSWGRFHAS